jgi:SPP1 gp7 family putative phage head morphogenesis protein
MSVAEFLLRQKKPNRRGKIVLPPPPKSRPPVHLERQYQTELKKAILADLQNAALQYIRPAILPALRMARAENGRFDSAIDEMLNAFRLARISFSRALTPAEIERMARKYADAGEAFNRAETGAQFGRVLGVNPLMIDPKLNPVMQNFVRENTELIKSIGDQFFDKLQKDTFDHIQAGVYNKEYAGKLTEQFADEYQSQWERGILAKRVQNAEARSNLIARDQISKYNGQLARARQTSLGLTKYRWSTSGDERVRESHKANDGKIFSWDNPPETGHPGSGQINCRCVAIPVFDTGVTDDPELLALLNKK